MQNELRTGPVTSSDGAINPGRTDRQAAAVITGAHGSYAEGAGRKNIYFSYVAAVATTVPATTFLGNLVWNPPDSGVVLSMLKWSSQIQVGAAAAELGITIGYSAQAVTPTSTPVIADASGSTFLGAGSPSSGKAKAYKDCEITVAITPDMNLHQITAAIAITGVDQVDGDFRGLWTIPPGYLVGLQAITNAIDAAGHTSTLTWEEIPV